MSGEINAEPSFQVLALERIDSAPFQIRQSIDEEFLRELASSMKRQGLLQPVLVRRKGERFELVAGERSAARTRSSRTNSAPSRSRSSERAHLLRRVQVRGEPGARATKAA